MSSHVSRLKKHLLFVDPPQPPKVATNIRIQTFAEESPPQHTHTHLSKHLLDMYSQTEYCSYKQKTALSAPSCHFHAQIQWLQFESSRAL